MKRISIIMLLTFLGLINIYAQERVVEKVVAVVGDNIILKSEVDQQYAQYLTQGNKADEKTKCSFLQNMLSQKLLTQQAVLDSITVTEDDIDNEVNRRMRVMSWRTRKIRRIFRKICNPV
jgi:peptidyl-prolyl cis-trans isomerase SurA